MIIFIITDGYSAYGNSIERGEGKIVFIYFIQFSQLYFRFVVYSRIYSKIMYLFNKRLPKIFNDSADTQNSE